ncbi:MAG: cobalt transporter CbiM [Desulfitobacteriaceae bacterium]
MHIPDGYLSPQTNVVLGAASALAVAVAAAKTARTVKAKYIPLLSIGAAFAFTIQMFNIPVPDGTTAHAVGGTLLTILLGPWAAMISIAVALTLQALFFGDGGILALGANIFNMGVILPFVSYAVYRVAAGGSAVQSKRRLAAAAIAGYIGITAAAGMAGVEFGLQPLLFHTANGTPLYSPYGLNVAVPAMLFAHLTIAGPVEALVTAMVIAYLQRSNSALLAGESHVRTSGSVRWRRVVVTFAILVALTPLGLLAKGTAWGEWSGEEIQAVTGFIPAGMQRFSGFWRHTLLPDYAIAGHDQMFWQQTLGYLISALAGLALIAIATFIIQRIMRKGGDRDGSAPLAPRK